MKKIISLVLAFFLLGTLFSFGYAEPPITVVLDGEILVFDQEPIIQKDRVLVPMRVIFEALGATVDWNAQTKTVTA